MYTATIFLNDVVDFAREGGIAVLGGLFSLSVRPDNLNKYFDKKCGLPWKAVS